MVLSRKYIQLEQAIIISICGILTGTKDYSFLAKHFLSSGTFITLFRIKNWDDDRLKWKMSDYPNVTQLYFDPKKLWKPDSRTSKKGEAVNFWILRYI